MITQNLKKECFKSIEQHVDISEPGEDGFIIKRKGYRLAWYGEFALPSREQLCKWIHPALIFARCFFKATGEDYILLSASRIQHLSGRQSMKMNELRKNLCDRTPYGYTFGHFVTLAKRLGWEYLPVEMLRWWINRSYKAEVILPFMNKKEYDLLHENCLICVLCGDIRCRSVVKIGSYWIEVDVISSPKGMHINNVEEFGSVHSDHSSVIMEMSHVIRYHAADIRLLDDVKYGRIIRWMHRCLRYEMMNDGDEDSI